MRAPGSRGWFGALLACLAAPALAAGAEPAGVAFFEQKIRPVLVQECYKCHSDQAKTPKGGLRLDSRAGLLKGGDSGPAVVPGAIDESLIIEALRHEGLAMPPTGKLPITVVADFERWIRMGAPDPRDGSAAPVKAGIDLDAGRRFWAFQPPRHPEVPEVSNDSWPRSDFDRFILAALEARGLEPVRDADRLTLIRRATIDLTGLPPSPEEVDAFVNDSFPDAFARVVDRLLASPRFGERWGRHWLDLARYADSNGKDENLTFHDAWRYRDYVIAAFNGDKPYDRFLREQLAGDLLPASAQTQEDEHLTATGFLIVGPKVLADRDFVKRKADVVDEQVDTVGRVFLGLTIGCARCHDHKFDPIPTADYYALAGIFASTHTLDGIKLGNAVVSGWMIRPLGEDGPAQLAAQQEHQKQVTALAAVIKKVKAELAGHEDRATMRQAGKLVGIVVDDAAAERIGAWKPSKYSRPYVGDGYLTDDKDGKGEKSVTFTPALPKAGSYEVYVGYAASQNRSRNTPVTVRFAGGEETVLVDQTERATLDGMFRLVGTYSFEEGTSGSVTISNRGTTEYVIVDAVRFVPVGALEKDAEMAMGVPAEVRQRIAEAREKLQRLEAEQKALKAAAPPAPSMVLAARDEEKPADGRINIRGNPSSHGAEVPRGFLSVASTGPPPIIPAGQSGRNELARWLADPANPLTARVMVNRVWQHLLGEGLVRTVDNFGKQGETPSHPELLDELAMRFMDDGWSIKRLIRSIALSRVYQLACVTDPAAAQDDPENRLLWRAHRRRVEAEVIRDAILTVSGQLDTTMGGSAVATLGERAIDNESKGGLSTDGNTRRSVYLPVIRNDVPPIFEVFDFADPEVATGRRDATTVATQALYLMNSPFVLDQARAAAQRLLALPLDDAGRITELFRRALGRPPTDDEVQQARRFLGEEPDLDAWSEVCLAVFGCTEFRFLE